MVKKTFLGQVSFRVIGFSAVSVTPPVLRTDFHLHATLSPWAYGRNPGTRKKQRSLENIGALNRKILSVSSLKDYSCTRNSCVLYCSGV
jgi:hypothetical protein